MGEHSVLSFLKKSSIPKRGYYALGYTMGARACIGRFAGYGEDTGHGSPWPSPR